MMRRMMTKPLRLLHTSDWHLGQELHGLSREAEHRAFLDWLLEALGDHAVDALVVTGDVFDSQNPPVRAQQMLYDVLAKAKARHPGLDIVIIGGNHDSAARLEAPNALLRPLGVHVVGSLPADPAACLIPLTGSDGAEAAVVAAVPFLRLADLPPPADDAATDPLIEGVRGIYARVLEAARARAAGLPLVVTGHCYMTGTTLSELSERRILGGNQHALPADIFPADIAYVALGHLHKPQAVGGRETVRYSGSPFPMSVAEKDYRHQAMLVDIAPDGGTSLQALLIPREVDYLRVPRSGAAGVEAVLAELEALAVADPGRDRRPYLEVVVRLDAPMPSLRHAVEQALEGKPVRLCRLTTEYAGSGEALAATPETPDLSTLDPEDVFVRRWRSETGGEPDDALLEAFRELLETVQSGGADAAALEPAQ